MQAKYGDPLATHQFQIDIVGGVSQMPYTYTYQEHESPSHPPQVKPAIPLSQVKSSQDTAPGGGQPVRGTWGNRITSLNEITWTM